MIRKLFASFAAFLSCCVQVTKILVALEEGRDDCDQIQPRPSCPSSLYVIQFGKQLLLRRRLRQRDDVHKMSVLRVRQRLEAPLARLPSGRSSRARAWGSWPRRSPMQSEAPRWPR